MAEQINVVLAANEAYGRYCAATVRSLFAAASAPSRVTAHVLTNGFERRTADMLMRAAYERGGSVTIHRVDLKSLSSLPTLPHISTDTYSRIIAADALPHLDRFIYLDCDLVVCDNVRKLHDMSLKGNAVGGIPHRNSSLGREFDSRFGLNDNADSYINAGVLLVDASAWRRDAVGEWILGWMNENSCQLAYSDQDAINFYFRGRITELPFRWNVEARHYQDRLNGVTLDEDDRKSLDDPAIIHYTGAVKPWSFDAPVPCREQYLRHLDAVLLGAGMLPVQRSRSVRNATRLIARSIRFRLGRLRRTFLRPG